MASADIEVVQSDTAPSIFGSLKNKDGSAFDLTDAVAIRLQVRPAIDRRFSIDAVGTIVTPATGSVRYDLQAGDLETAGDYSARWRIEWSDGSFEHSDPANTLTIAAQ